MCKSPRSQSCVTVVPSSQHSLLKVKKYSSLCGYRIQSLQVHPLHGSFLGRPCPMFVHQQGFCSEGAISLFLQHKFFVSSHHHQTVQQQRHKGTQHLLLYFMPCKILGLWHPVFNRGCSQGLLSADWLPVAAHSASMEFVQPGCRAQPCTRISVMLAAAPQARLGLAEGQAETPWLKKKLLEENGAEPRAVFSV